MRQFVAQMISRRPMPTNLEYPQRISTVPFDRRRIAVGEGERGAFLDEESREGYEKFRAISD